jgi:hypothetical protein
VVAVTKELDSSAEFEGEIETRGVVDWYVASGEEEACVTEEERLKAVTRCDV